MRRHRDWLRQAKRKLESAQWAIQGQFYEDACFAAQQAAELAAKALLESQGRVELGHSVLQLLRPQECANGRFSLQLAFWIGTTSPHDTPMALPKEPLWIIMISLQPRRRCAVRRIIVAFVETQIAGI
jgi:hypothetical protein